jgi:hypothetical protein
MDTNIEVNETDDYVDGDAIINKRDHYFFKKVMKERVITFKGAKIVAGEEVSHIVDLTPELIQVQNKL